METMRQVIKSDFSNVMKCSSLKKEDGVDYSASTFVKYSRGVCDEFEKEFSDKEVWLKFGPHFKNELKILKKRMESLIAPKNLGSTEAENFTQ